MNDEERRFVENLYFDMYENLLIRAKVTFKDDFLAEEAVQDTFRVVCENVTKLMVHPNLNGYIAVTLSNITKQILTKHTKETAIAKRIIEYIDPDSEVCQLDVDIDLLYENLSEDKDFMLIKQYITEQCTILEFARKLGISADACAKRLQRARAHLKKYFEKL